MKRHALFPCATVHVGVPIARPDIHWDHEHLLARLRWNRVYTPPYHRVDIPLRYQIEVQDLPKRSWRPLARGITMEEYDIKDLTPDRDYMFRLRAESVDGELSEATPPIPFYGRSLSPSRKWSNIAIGLSPTRFAFFWKEISPTIGISVTTQHALLMCLNCGLAHADQGINLHFMEEGKLSWAQVSPEKA